MNWSILPSESQVMSPRMALVTRIGSNFAIYPKQNFAFLVWDPTTKIVRSTATECVQGSRRVESEVRFTIFTGTPREIYRQFLESRNQYGYPVLKPKYEYFGVGWEAYGALAWDTNYKTVTANVDHRSEEHTSELQSPMYLV